MSIKGKKVKGRGRAAGKEYWRNECRKAREERGFYESWSAAQLLLLNVATFAIIYLLKFGG